MYWQWEQAFYVAVASAASLVASQAGTAYSVYYANTHEVAHPFLHTLARVAGLAFCAPVRSPGGT